MGTLWNWGYYGLTFVGRNAGGRTSDLTSEMVKTCQGLIGIETCMHLTCTNMPREKVDIALRVRFVLPWLSRVHATCVG